MAQLISQYIIPFLTIVTVLFIIVALKALMLSSVQKEHQKETTKQFSYTQVALSNLGGDLKEVKGVIAEALVPRMDEVYKSVLKRGIELEGGNLIKLLTEIGLEKHLVLSEDNTIVITGLEAEGLKVIFLFTWKEKDKDLLIHSFAYSLKNITRKTALLLLNFNSLLKTGTLWVKQYESKSVIGIDYTFYLPSRYIEPEAVDRAINRIFAYYDDLKTLLSSQQVSIDEMLPEEYFKLEETPHQNLLELLESKTEKKQLEATESTPETVTSSKASDATET